MSTNIEKNKKKPDKNVYYSNVKVKPRVSKLLGAQLGAVPEQVQGVYLHPSKFANGCIAPVLIHIIALDRVFIFLKMGYTTPPIKIFCTRAVELLALSLQM